MVQEELPPAGAAEGSIARTKAVALGVRSSPLGSCCCHLY